MPKVGVGVLVIQQGKILLGRRKNAHGAGSWSAPGGHLEEDERVVECAIRELYEETGLHAHRVTLGPWHEVFFQEANTHYLNLYTFVTEYSGQLENKEPHKCECWQWFDTDNLPTPLFPSLKKITDGQSLKPFLQENLHNLPESLVENKPPTML